MPGGKKRLFTGLQPSGSLHIGNYFGTLKPLLSMYEEYESYLCVVDYHALTTVRDGKELAKNSLEMARDFLALGFDPTKGVLFKQSDVPEHTELAWILSCVTPVAMLELAHAYKDTAGKGKEASAGLFTYPVLMAADILLYDTNIVPVGEDQRQHVEYARDIATKFNVAFGETFVKPESKILTSVAVVPGTDGRKMSKSYKNTIPLFATKDEIREAVMSIVTDSVSIDPNSIKDGKVTKLIEGHRPKNVYAIHKLFREEGKLATLYESHKGNYKELKEALIDDVEAFIAPMRERREGISDTDVKKVLKEGGEKAKEKASEKMEQVRTRIGVDSR